ncbi:MAG: hypothetical protein ROZ37_00400 [Aromatoleum sp.]|jgi:hypothetical protein|uniref:hypothetical protein n=1 Tax=Aromatoleum sp. TaxID=2307007 RepID=UPI002893BD24|nr:hypothetical protein [Aromatoleum sp.]MDT3668776.1 hypothetical protein [Aromatoleum sp.]
MLSPAPPAPATSERRRYDHVRGIFAEASALIAPFFAKENRWGNSTLDHLAYRVIRDRYPELSFEEVYVLVIASRRVYSARVPETDIA